MQKNANLLTHKKNIIDVDDTNANRTSDRISMTKTLVSNNYRNYHQPFLSYNPYAIFLADKNSNKASSASDSTDQGSPKKHQACFSSSNATENNIVSSVSTGREPLKNDDFNQMHQFNTKYRPYSMLMKNKNEEIGKIGRNGFKNGFRGVGKTKNKNCAKYYCKNTATSSTHQNKWPGTHEYTTDAAKSFDEYLIATKCDKANLNFASESEYLLALDEEKNTNLLALKKYSIDVDDANANSTSDRISSTKPLVFDNNDMHHQASLLSNPTRTYLVDNTSISPTFASASTAQGLLKRDDSYDDSHSKHHGDKSSSLSHPINDDRLVNVWNIFQVFSVDKIKSNYFNRTHPCQGNGCKLPACCKWLYKRTGEVWYSCRDCQESKFNLDGWPMFEKVSIDVSRDEAHMFVINNYCSAKYCLI